MVKSTPESRYPEKSQSWWQELFRSCDIGAFLFDLGLESTSGLTLRSATRTHAST